ncbi:MAG: alpha/beta fold hydrolase [Solirubrobacterales bacterium]|nr:alpha/beta fold hydrolase [Solirubrobacterales bacterium]
MAAIELRERDGLAYREAIPEGGETAPPALLVHGFPQSSRMWVEVMEALAGGGRRCVAPDLYGLGDSAEQAPATFERNLEALTGLHRDLELGRVALVVHDWGGFVGLAWACDHPAEVEALVISDTGFFSDGRWHGMADAVRGEQGEELVAALDRDGFAALLGSQGAAFEEADIDAYWAPFAAGRGRRATVDFYRSMDFSKLARWDGRLAELGVPTLLLWGEGDEFAPLAGARRFQREIPGARLAVVEGAGHFVFDQEPRRCAREVAAFLAPG